MLRENITVIGAAIELTTGGAVRPHVGIDGEGSTSELSWKDKYKDKYKPMKKR